MTETMVSEAIKAFKQDAKLVVANWKPIQKELQATMNLILSGKPEVALERLVNVCECYDSEMSVITCTLTCDDEGWNETAKLLDSEERKILSDVRRRFGALEGDIVAAKSRIDGYKNSWTRIQHDLMYDMKSGEPLVSLKVLEGHAVIFETTDSVISLASLAHRMLAICAGSLMYCVKKDFEVNPRVLEQFGNISEGIKKISEDFKFSPPSSKPDGELPKQSRTGSPSSVGMGLYL